MTDPKPPESYRFEPGDVVRHKRYGYRGVVFRRDTVCEATETWYQGNQTQPGRNQPWYHVLVDGGHHTTYVAQSNLEPDNTGAPIQHPSLDRFFKTHFEGRYYRDNLN